MNKPTISTETIQSSILCNTLQYRHTHTSLIALFGLKYRSAEPQSTMYYHDLPSDIYCLYLHLSTDRYKEHTHKLEALGRNNFQAKQTRNLGSIIFEVVDTFTFIDPFTVSVTDELVSDVVPACLKIRLNKNLDTVCGQQSYLHIYRLGQRCRGRKNKRSASTFPRINRVLSRLIEKSR